MKGSGGGLKLMIDKNYCSYHSNWLLIMYLIGRISMINDKDTWDKMMIVYELLKNNRDKNICNKNSIKFYENKEYKMAYMLLEKACDV